MRIKWQSCFFLLLFFLVCKGTAQEVKEIIREWTAYSQKVDVTDFIGQDFKVSAMIRKDLPKNDGSNAAIWARIEQSDGSTGFFENQVYMGSASEEWQKFTISGTVDKTGAYLYFGAFCQNNGNFYFDDFELEVKLKNGKWQPVPISNPGFEIEASDDLWDEGIRKSKLIKTKHFKINYDSTSVISGSKALHIKGQNIIGSNQQFGNKAAINGVTLYYEIYGEGEPLLLIHGNGQSASAFLQQTEEFSKYYRVIVVDCRGRGKSTYQKDIELTYDLQVEDMILLLDHLKLKSAHVVGWSDGGIIGLRMAMKHPEKVKKLVAMGANINPEGLIDLEELKQSVHAWKKADNPDFSLQIDLYNLMINYPQLDYKNLGVISSPTLIMAGDKDVIKHTHTVQMYEAIPNAQLAILPNETHYMPSENAALFNRLVLDFLRD